MSIRLCSKPECQTTVGCQCNLLRPIQQPVEITLSQFALNDVQIDINEQIRKHAESQKGKNPHILMPFVVDVHRCIRVYLEALQDESAIDRPPKRESVLANIIALCAEYTNNNDTYQYDYPRALIEAIENARRGSGE